MIKIESLTRWTPCEVDPDDEDGPVFQGFLTDPAGAWVKFEDLAEITAELSRAVDLLQSAFVYSDVRLDSKWVRLYDDLCKRVRGT